MATLAAQTGVDPHDVSGSKIRKILQYTGPASYATGGETINAYDAGLGAIDEVLFAGAAYDGTDFRLVTWQASTGKVVWFVPNTNAQVANGTDLSAFIVQVEVIGH